MPEIKHVFQAGKMNKDIDIRLVQNGEYRDALNIQVRTTDTDGGLLGDGTGSSGAAQNLKGNSLIDAVNVTVSYIDDDGSGVKDYTRVIGSLADEANDRAFFFAADPLPFDGVMSGVPYSDIVAEGQNDDGSSRLGYSLRQWRDFIFEIDFSNSNGNGSYKNHVFTDVYMVTATYIDMVGQENVSDSTDYAFIVMRNNGSWGDEVRDVRVGMILYAYNEDGEDLVHTSVTLPDGTIVKTPGVEVINIDEDYGMTDQAIVLAEKQNANLEDNCVAMKFVHPKRVLEFDYYKEETLLPLGGNTKVKNTLTSMNVIDDLIFWTDGKHEPRKINIERSKAGTISDRLHTDLYVTHPVSGDLVILTDEAIEPNLVTSDIQQENVTVLKKAPITAPTLKFASTDRASDTSFDIDYNFVTDALPVPTEGSIVTIDFPSTVDARIDDVFKFVADADFANEPMLIRGKIISTEDEPQYVLRLSFVSDEVVENNPLDWEVELEQRKPFFETKFGRFAYRYKYDDGEYSSFSPWSELAFLPGDFDYTPSKGYNKAMTSNIRSLIVTGFIPNDTGIPTFQPTVSIKPSGVKAVDVLWKTTNDQNVYVVKTITRVKDIEWTADETGSMTITSEMIHKVLPANQTLRSWDNVPRNAIAQEMTANRLIYGNYIQGYDILQPFGLKQSLKSKTIQFPNPKKSVKSSRNYKFGAVFGDEYGRETPVIASGYRNPNMGFEDGQVEENITGDLNVPKNLASFSNRFELTQSWDESVPPDWMKYIKYFVKETSNEYYNLIMDRWYDAEDGNIWVAFPSVDRNKIDEETFLLLKNAHGSQEVVTEEARYKVIAIENSAPDYIKTVNNDFDEITINRDFVYSGLQADVIDAIPDKLIDNRTIELTPDDFSEISPSSKDFKGIAKGRIVGTFTSATDGEVKEYSPWVNLAKIINEEDSENGDPGKKGVVFRAGYESTDANLYLKILAKLTNPAELSDNVATVDNITDEGVEGAGYIKYSIQLRDSIVENKPQFDGRFFVKLEKDTTLETTVLGNQISYQVSNTYKVAYIAAREKNPAKSEDIINAGPYAQINWSTYTGGLGGGADVFTSSEIKAIVPNIEASDTDVLNYNSLDNLVEGDLPAIPTAGVTVESINENANSTHSTFGEDKNQVVPLFGPGDHEDNAYKTEQFWSWWFDNAGRDTNVFIDEAPAYSGFSLIRELENLDEGTTAKRQVLQALNSGYQPISHLIDNNVYGPYPGEGNGDSTEATYPNPAYNLEWSTTTGENQNWLPRGLSNGSLQSGQMGQFTFSVIKDNWDSDSQDALFKQDMQTVGTVFQFVGDPNPNFYKIINYNAIVHDNFGAFSGSGIQIESKNFSSTDGELRKRYTIITRFCKLDSNNNELLDEGIDIKEWDPRGEVRHDGIGSLEIQIMRQIGNFDLTDKSLATNAACWETEPKEDVGLDIYYEASEAVPINLENKKDLTIYTRPSVSIKSASNIELYRGFNKVETQTVPYVNRVLSNDAINLRYQTYEEYNGVIIPTYSIDFKGAGIGDEIHFLHKSNPYGSGIITKSKIIGHYDLLSGLPDNTEIPVPSPTGSLIVTPILTPGVVGVTLIGDIPSEFEGQSLVGAQIFGENIGAVAFVESQNAFGDLFVPGIKLINVADDFWNLNMGKPITIQFTIATGWYKIDTNVWKYPIELGWFNCYSFGNGVESDRIQDDFNAPTIDNGVKVSSTFLDYGEERIGSGLIYSGLYNSTSSVNDLNEFNMAEKITKNLNPIYGSIQALKTAERNLTVFAEDKVLKVLANKDAIYNADGNPQLTATNRVLGDATAYAGDYGISKNPESLAWDQYRMYFTDKQRGAVLRLSNDGLTPISEIGMSAYFRERMKSYETMLGTFDTVSGEYNLTLTDNPLSIGVRPPKTISFNERAKGWVSFKSFLPSTGLSVNGRYITVPSIETSLGTIQKKLGPWNHYSDSADRNNFYNTQYKSEIEVVFNDQPSIVKSFKTINYEGTQSKINKYIGSTESYGSDANGFTVSVNDGEYYNLTAKKGWWVESFTTDLQTGTVPEFINKENKWFNKINGVTTTLSNLDTNEFSVQGIGLPTLVTDATVGVDDGSPVNPSTETDLIISDSFDELQTGSLYGDDDL
tara:strand:- start:11491 stop:17856 length:6366 start_codon:yes stop_codon:yes gene_type:complete